MNRRDFLIGCSAGAAVLATSKLSFATTQMGLNKFGPDNDILVTIFLRGGCDGLNFLAPSSSSIYNDLRSSGVKVTDSGGNKGFELKNSLKEEEFRLHYNAPEINELYQSNELAFIHATGLKNGTRSHFVAQDLIERGVVKNGSTKTGWMARYLEKLGYDKTVIPGASMGGSLAEVLNGYGAAASISDLEEFELAEIINDHQLFRDWYGGDSRMDVTAKKTLDSIEYVQNHGHKYRADATYPSGAQYEELNTSLQNLAALIKMGTGIKVANVDFEGWDHHERQAMHFPGLVKTLSKSLMAFYQDIEAYRSQVSIVVMSEFGRRLKSNGSGGTDHGYGGMMMVLGGRVNGGKMYGKWPGLEKEQLNRGVDLEITTDYRAVLSEVMASTNKNINVFPGYTAPESLGIIRG